MKIINKYIVLLVVATLFVACSEDDDVAIAPASINIQVVVEPFVSSAVQIIGQVGTNNAFVELGFRLTEFSTTYHGSDVVILYNGGEYVIPAGENEVLIGATDIEFELESPGGDVPYDGTTLSARIDFDANYDIEVSNRPNDLVVLKGGALIVQATIYNKLPQSNSSAVEVLLDWENQSFDFDLYFSLGDVNANWLGDFDGSGSTSRYEDISLPIDNTYDNSVDIAPNVYYLDVYTFWAGASAGNYKFFIAFPDGTLQILDGTTVQGSDDNLQVKVTKTANVDTGLSDYTFEMVN